MHANVQWRHTHATGEEAPYYRLKESYRDVNARRPRTRYCIGHLSTTIVFFHWLLPTRWWDVIVRMMGRRKWM